MQRQLLIPKVSSLFQQNDPEHGYRLRQACLNLY